MGCDIHLWYERKTSNGWEDVSVPVDEWKAGPLDHRSYSTFGFLADVRNYSAITPISEPRGWPDDFRHSRANKLQEEDDRWWGSSDDNYMFDEYHTHAWLSIEELLAYDYDQLVEDRRVTRNGNGGVTCDPGEGKQETLREFLGEGFFEDLQTLKECGVERIVFAFDN
jgi:hypothetical protein